MTFAKTAAAALITAVFPLAAFAGHNTGNNATQSGPSSNSSVVAQNSFSRHHNQR